MECRDQFKEQDVSCKIYIWNSIWISERVFSRPY